MSPVALAAAEHGPAEAPAVLLAGSLGTTRAMWAPQVPALAASHRVIALDHRGHGASPVPAGPYALSDLGEDALALMDRLGIARAAWVGLSIGGMVGQWLALHAPERIAALVLICTSARMDSPDPWHERARTVRAAGSPQVVADAVLQRWFTPAWAAAHPAELARHRAMIAGTAAEGYAGCCEAIAGLQLQDELPAVRAPTLVLTAAGDEAIPPAHGRRIAAAIPGARLVELRPGAHLASVERADEVTALVFGHLREHAR